MHNHDTNETFKPLTGRGRVHGKCEDSQSTSANSTCVDTLCKRIASAVFRYNEKLYQHPDADDHEADHEPSENEDSGNLRRTDAEAASVEVVNADHPKKKGKDDVDAAALRRRYQHRSGRRGRWRIG